MRTVLNVPTLSFPLVSAQCLSRSLSGGAAAAAAAFYQSAGEAIEREREGEEEKRRGDGKKHTSTCSRTFLPLCLSLSLSGVSINSRIKTAPVALVAPHLSGEERIGKGGGGGEKGAREREEGEERVVVVTHLLKAAGAGPPPLAPQRISTARGRAAEAHTCRTHGRRACAAGTAALTAAQREKTEFVGRGRKRDNKGSFRFPNYPLVSFVCRSLSFALRIAGYSPFSFFRGASADTPRRTRASRKEKKKERRKRIN